MDLYGVCAEILTLTLLFIHAIADTTQFLEGRQGAIGAGNFTYYKLAAVGNIRILLQTVTGDADIYISQTSQQPTYENYDLKSATCGADEVYIPGGFKRPVWLGVYGYVTADVSTFQVLIYRLSAEDFTLDYIPESFHDDETSSPDKPYVPKINYKTTAEEGESLLWSIFVGFMKILLDVVL